MASEAKDDNVGMYVGLIVAIAIFITVVIVIVVLLRRKRRQHGVYDIELSLPGALHMHAFSDSLLIVWAACCKDNYVSTLNSNQII